MSGDRKKRRFDSRKGTKGSKKSEETRLESHRKSVESAAKGIIERYHGTLGEITRLKELVKSIDREMEWFRAHEPVILDSLRATMLSQFASDPDRRWSTTDFGILLDKARLIRGESSVNLSSLMSVVMQAEEAEIRRLTGKPIDVTPGKGEGD